MNRTTGIHKLLIAISMAGCTTSTVEQTSTRDDELYYLAASLWPQRDIPVCWTTTGNVTEKEWVRTALRGQRSWSQQGNINFVGWGTCSAGATGIHLTAGADNVSFGLGQSSGNANITLDFTASPETDYVRCTTNSLNREQCIKATAIHEFGHGLGYAHEHNRPERTADCTSAAQGTNGDATFGAFDIRSITAYCNFTTDLSPLDRKGTDRLYGPAYGDASRLHDSNGDGRDDLVCHNVTTGHKTVDRSDANGHLDGTDWERDANWCDTDMSRLYQGDFNGDGKSDLLCHDMATGHKWIDYADANGQYGGTDWQRDGHWCDEQTSRLYVGDFNGDGRDDLLCHDVVTGNKWMDLADANGQFNNTDWERHENWCGGPPTRRLYVGDFNGDHRADLLCHDVASGYKWIDYADANGQFNGTDWELDAKWCFHDTAELHIGDFNGDGKDDFLCHDLANGHEWIDYADAAGRFSGTDWQRDSILCAANGDHLHVGRLNSDLRDDLLCHTSKGYRIVDYANANGQFPGNGSGRGGDWASDFLWCTSAAEELH